MRYVVWEPGNEDQARVFEAPTSFEARKLAAEALGLSPAELCSMRQEHLSLVGHRKRKLLENAIKEESRS